MFIGFLREIFLICQIFAKLGTVVYKVRRQKSEVFWLYEYFKKRNFRNKILRIMNTKFVKFAKEIFANWSCYINFAELIFANRGKANFAGFILWIETVYKKFSVFIRYHPSLTIQLSNVYLIKWRYQQIYHSVITYKKKCFWYISFLYSVVPNCRGVS